MYLLKWKFVYAVCKGANQEICSAILYAIDKIINFIEKTNLVLYIVFNEIVKCAKCENLKDNFNNI